MRIRKIGGGPKPKQPKDRDTNTQLRRSPSFIQKREREKSQINQKDIPKEQQWPLSEGGKEQ